MVTQKPSALAIVSLVMGVLFCIPPLSLVGLITGAIELVNIKKGLSAREGEWMCWVGVVLGILPILCFLAWFVVTLFAGAATIHDAYTPR